MRSFKHIPLLPVFLLCLNSALAQLPDSIYKPGIYTARLHMYGNQLSLPVYNIGSNDQLELHFDELGTGIKNYYYTFVLCDYNWQPVDLSPFNYIKGFTQQRITTYRYSTIAFTRYTHYQANLPDRNMVPSRSGNYMLKIFLDGDTSKLVFTKRLLVLEQKATAGGQVVQPFTPQLYRTHQKLIYNVNIAGLNTFSAAQQVKVVILQNNRWDNAQRDIAPSFIRGTVLEYNTENNSTFAAGKEWRWLDLRSFRLQSDRVLRADYRKDGTDIFLKTDGDRSGQKYSYFRDFNGMYSTETYETINPYTQGDYAKVHFSFAPPGNKPYSNKELYVNGLLTNYQFSADNRMVFNDSTGTYEATLFLKQGFYNYGYITVDTKNQQRYELEGDYFETENVYTILVYYRSFTDRADQLIGIGTLLSQRSRPGISF
jgi:Domain of unknown function (DUF5103)